MRARWLPACLLLLAVGGGGHSLLVSVSGQEPGSPVFRAGVRAVRVDVSVLDRQDRAVDGLTAADFELREDGVLQHVTSAQFLRRDGSRQSNLDEGLTIRSRDHAEIEAARDDVRLFAIFLDDYHIDKDQQITLRVREALQGFLKGFGPNDLLVVMDPLTPLSALRYTRSIEDVQERIRTFEGRQGQLFPVRSVMEEAQIQSNNVWQIRATVTLSALEALVAHLSGLGDARKSVLFVSQGPPMSTSYPENEAHLQSIVQAANRGNVTIHAFDPRPLGASQPGGAYVLSRLAGETGGRAVANSNAPLPQLRQTLADASAYYLLGYTPSRGADDGRFHRIEVKALRPGLRITARRGYWAPSTQELSAARPAPVVEARQTTALAGLVAPVRGRIADVWLGASRGAAEMTAVTVAWETAGSGPAALGPQVLEVGVADGSPGAAGGGPVWLYPPRAVALGGTERFELEPGRLVAWRFTVKGAAETLDQWEQKMPVPEMRKNRVVLSTPIFFRARTAQQARALAAGTRLAPAAGRQFRASDRVQVDVESYGGETPVEVSAEVLGRSGKSLVNLPVTPLAGGRHQVGLPVASLGQGTYVLRLSATDGTAGAEERVAFEVAP